MPICLPAHEMRLGDVDAALARAPHRIKGSVVVGGQDHFYLEGQVAYAIPGEAGDMLVHSSTQHPAEVQHTVAKILGLPDNAVTVEVRRMGGGFGGKESQPALIAGDRGARRGEDRPAGKAPARPRRRHGDDRQAARFSHRLRRGLRRRTA